MDEISPVVVTNGTGSGNYSKGSIVTITADSPESGKQFKEWNVVSGGAILVNSKLETTTFIMQGDSVEVKAIYEDKLAPIDTPIPTVPVAPITTSTPTVPTAPITTPTPIVPSTPSVLPTPEPEKPKANNTYKVSGVSYKVSNASTTKGEVAFVASKNKANTVKIAESVEINGYKYKVTSVLAGAFKDNNEITEVIIGSNVKRIDKYAFYGCTKLKKVAIGKNVTESSAYSFEGCIALTSVTIPANVTIIGKNAFYGDKNLKWITIECMKLKSVGKNVINKGNSKVTIKVPSIKLNEYKKFFGSKVTYKEIY